MMRRSLSGLFWMMVMYLAVFAAACWLIPACGQVAESDETTDDVRESDGGTVDEGEREPPSASLGDEITSGNNNSENNTAEDESPVDDEEAPTGDVGESDDENDGGAEAAGEAGWTPSASGISDEEFESGVSDEPLENSFVLDDETADEVSGADDGAESAEAAAADEQAAAIGEEAPSESAGFDEPAEVPADGATFDVPSEGTMEEESTTFSEPEVVTSDVSGPVEATEVVEEGTEPVFEYGGGLNFKVPVPPGYDWEVTQSWGEHCAMCADRYTDWDYCALTHNTSCCRYSWDFNLPGTTDTGKPVVASANGVVKKVGYNSGWGYHVIVDHGNNLCSRYGHLLAESTDHLEEGANVCQGLQLGQIGMSGNAAGPHLHYQFEDCTTAAPIPLEFEDGNGNPVCTRGDDRYDDAGNYSFLRLTNALRLNCDDPVFLEDVPEGKWRDAACGDLSGCPLQPDSQRMASHAFSDYYYMSNKQAEAASYLWSEAAIDGGTGGQLDPFEYVKIAEALKVALYLYGMLPWCDIEGPLHDDEFDDWEASVMVCAFRNFVVSQPVTIILGSAEIGFGEAAKYLVRTASIMGLVMVRSPEIGHFPYIPSSDPYYEYVETLYEHGGITENMLEYSSSDTLRRGNFVVMAAALSPCFCGSVNCEEGCWCNQANFMCSGPSIDVTATTYDLDWSDDDENDTDVEEETEADEPDSVDETPVEEWTDTGWPTSGDGSDATGSSDDVASEDEGNTSILIDGVPADEYENDYEDDYPGYDPYSEDYDLDLEINCRMPVERNICGTGVSSGEVEFFVSCMVTNQGDEDVHFENMFMYMDDPDDADVCRFTRSEFLRTASALTIEADGRGHLSSEFSFICSEPLEDALLEVSFDVAIQVDDDRMEFYAYRQVDFPIPDTTFATCEHSPDCNPFLDYVVHVEGGHGSLQMLMWDNSPSIMSLLPDGELVFHMRCTDLPAAFYASGDGDTEFWLEPGYLVPPLEVWCPYSGSLTLMRPAAMPIVTTGEVVCRLNDSASALVRIPSENLP